MNEEKEYQENTKCSRFLVPPEEFGERSHEVFLWTPNRAQPGPHTSLVIALLIIFIFNGDANCLSTTEFKV